MRRLLPILLTALVTPFSYAMVHAQANLAFDQAASTVNPLMTEHARKMEQHKREMKQVQDRLRQNGSNDLTTARVGATSRPQATPFNAAGAPPPADCLKAFVATARNANSMEQVLGFLPQDEQTAMKARQSSYDPKEAAHGREWHKKTNPKLTGEQLTHLSNPPFVNGLKFHKGLANEIRDILSVKVDGNQATLVVSTSSGATINGEYYPYGKADVEMVGEGNYWKLSRFRPSVMYFKEPPQAP